MLFSHLQPFCVPPLAIFTLQFAVIDVWSYLTMNVNIKHFSAKQLYMEW